MFGLMVCGVGVCFFFFFKQKTAYEMRISDWSSDLCSSDLDAPFVAVAVESEGEGRDRRLGFRLNTGDAVIAGPDNALRIEDGEAGPRPYVHVRAGLDALGARAPYYELVAWALEEEGDPPGLWSGGVFFPLGGRKSTRLNYSHKCGS